MYIYDNVCESAMHHVSSSAHSLGFVHCGSWLSRGEKPQRITIGIPNHELHLAARYAYRYRYLQSAGHNSMLYA
jgi:hypothetical protein